MRLVLLGVFVLVGCGGLPEQLALCREGMTHICERLLACQGSLVVREGGPNLTIGQCANLLAADECAPEKLKCNPGTTFNAAKGRECADGFSNWTCAELSSDHFPPAPAACSDQCQ
jgi:hypothetical protein